jgi:hypothetical protein
VSLLCGQEIDASKLRMTRFNVDYLTMLTNIKLEQLAHQAKFGVLQEDIIFKRCSNMDDLSITKHRYIIITSEIQDYWTSSSNRINIEPSQ